MQSVRLQKAFFVESGEGNTPSENVASGVFCAVILMIAL